MRIARASATLVASLALLACGAGDAPPSGVEHTEINGGEPDTFDRSVGILRLEGTGYCTGVLVTPTIVLTAAHCVVERRIIAFYLGPGRRVLDSSSTEALDGMRRYDVDAQAGYPDFTPMTRYGPCPFGTLDVGLVKLSRPAARADGVPHAIEYRRPVVGEPCEAVGFGRHERNGQRTHHEKRRATERMREARPTALAFDALSGNTEPGDSGGPLFCDGKIVAVNSCNSNPDWFARLDAARPWLEEMLADWSP